MRDTLLDDAEVAQTALIDRYGRAFSAGEAIFREGEAAREAFLLQEGRVRSLTVLRPGELFGESALLDDAPRASTAVALTDGIALAFDPASFRALVEQRSHVALRIIQQLVRRVRDAEDQVELMLLKDTQSKIVSALLKLAGNGATGVELSISPVDLSARVGLDVDTVKRSVARLREQSYVRIVGERVEIPDVDALRRLYALLGSKEELRGGA